VEVKALELQQESLLDGRSDFQSCKSHPSKRMSSFIADYQAVSQDELSGILVRHIAAEKLAGKEIHPPARKQSLTQEGTADNECTQLFAPIPLDAPH
jgi:hypothetical protein